MEDGRIVELFLKRQEEAVSLTSEKYGARLRKLADNIVEDWPMAQECENDTYLEAWNTIPPHEPRTFFFAFLARITRHLALDRCRSRNRLKRSARLVELTQEMEQCIPAPNDTEGQIDGVLLGEAVSSFLKSLPEEQRKIFLRRYWYLDSIAEIASLFSRSEGSVKTLLFRCRKGLREMLPAGIR